MEKSLLEAGCEGKRSPIDLQIMFRRAGLRPAPTEIPERFLNIYSSPLPEGFENLAVGLPAYGGQTCG
jgi:hypothetical protein